jgi:hypothetical protein
MIEVIGFGKPVRLFVGGLHGLEGSITESILRRVSRKIEKGSLIICNLTIRSKYVTTLNPAYYQTETGRQLLSLIREYKPEIYLELHCYRRGSYSRLTSPNRRNRIGVPPLVELEDGILLGSISPQIRMSEFKRDDLCLTFDVPEANMDDDKVIKILNRANLSLDKFDYLERLRKMYPEQIRIAEINFHNYFKDVTPF